MSQVSLVKCDSYDQTLVETAIQQSLANLGGIAQFVKPGQTVLIKPNALLGASPDHAVTTHPAVIAAALGDAPVKLMPNLATAELDLREQSRGKEFWKYALIALLAVLAVEQTLARRFTHYA